MGKLIALAGKDLRLLLRDRGGAFFAFVFPLIMAIFFGTAFSGAGGGGDTAGIQLVVVDQDQTEASAALYARLDDMSEIRPTRADLATAEEQVRKGRVDAYLLVESGYGEAENSLFDDSIPTVKLVTDPRRSMEQAMLSGLLMGDAAEQLQDKISDTDAFIPDIDAALVELEGADPEEVAGMEHLQPFLTELRAYLNSEEVSAEQATGEGAGVTFSPLEIETDQLTIDRARPLTAFDISFPQGIVWGILGVISTFAVSLVSERNQGTLLRLTISPTARWKILAGKALACFAAVVMVCTVLMLIGIVFFGVTVQSPLLLGLGILTAGFCFSGVMMGLSVMGKTEKSAGGLVWAFLMPMAMLGGGMLPLAVMPSWMAELSDLSPVKWAVLAFEGALWRGFSLTDMLPALLIMLAVGLVAFLIGTRFFRWQQA